MDLNRIVSMILRFGVIVSAILAATGIFAWATLGFAQNLDFNYSTFVNIALSAIMGDPIGLIYLAVIILVATPIVRIIFSVVYFMSVRDKQYTAITLAVLVMMLFAIFLIPR